MADRALKVRFVSLSLLFSFSRVTSWHTSLDNICCLPQNASYTPAHLGGGNHLRQLPWNQSPPERQLIKPKALERSTNQPEKGSSMWLLTAPRLLSIFQSRVKSGGHNHPHKQLFLSDRPRTRCRSPTQLDTRTMCIWFHFHIETLYPKACWLCAFLQKQSYSDSQRRNKCTWSTTATSRAAGGKQEVSPLHTAPFLLTRSGLNGVFFLQTFGCKLQVDVNVAGESWGKGYLFQKILCIRVCRLSYKYLARDNVTYLLIFLSK